MGTPLVPVDTSALYGLIYFMTPFERCLNYVLNVSQDETKSRFPSQYRMFVWFSLKECKYLFDDTWLYEGVGEFLIESGNIKLSGLGNHQGEKMIKYRFPSLRFKCKREHIPLSVKRQVFEDYNWECANCSATKNLSIDHIVPVVRGGGSEKENLQLLCMPCNLKKHTKIIYY